MAAARALLKETDEFFNTSEWQIRNTTLDTAFVGRNRCCAFWRAHMLPSVGATFKAYRRWRAFSPMFTRRK